MANRFVRSSKYRHVFGRSTRKEQCYDNLRVSRNAWDTNLLKANPEYLSVNWESGGGGAFAVIPVKERGRLPERIPLFRGHTAVVLDTDWNPFNDSLVSSASDDGKIFLWRVPDNFTLHVDKPAEEIEDISPVGRLPGHGKKVGHVLFNPAAENVLASASGDYTVKLWDIEAGSSKLSLKVGEVIQSLSWSANGSLLVTTSRDKKLRIWDTRQEKPAHEVNGHAGAKNSRAVWMGEHDRIATTGFSRMSDRQMALWDARAPEQPIDGFQMLDSISGVCMPFWDDGTQCLYLAGKGDGNIRYYEYEHDKFEYLSEYKSADPQRGVAFVPKRGVNMHENEVMRAYKTVNDTYIEPISFIVPRRSESFQDDIYPPTTGLKPAMSSKEWFDGKEALPPKISLESIFEGTGVKEVDASEVPKPAKSPEPVKAPEPKKEVKASTADTPSTSTVRAPPPSMKDQGESVRAMVDKYNDDEEASKKEEESDFEDVPKAATRTSATKPASTTPTAAAVTSPSIKSPPITMPSESVKSKTEKVETPPAAAKSLPTDVKSPEPVLEPTTSNKTSAKDDPTEKISGGADDIMGLLTQHTREIADLNRIVAELRAELKSLKER